MKANSVDQNVKVDNCNKCEHKRAGICDKFGYVINPVNKDGLMYYIVDSEECLEYKKK